MKTIYGASNWRLVVESVKEGIRILRAQTPDVDAVFPDSIDELPIIEIADKAMSRTVPDVKGEEILICCGSPQNEWDNQSIQTLSLPSSLKKIGNYSFAGCSSIKKVIMYDNIEEIGIRVFMNCRFFKDVIIYGNIEKSLRMASGLLKESNVEIELLVEGTEKVRLLFPEYYESINQKGPTQFFDYNIEGVGYPYHYVFSSRNAQLNSYDSTWGSWQVSDIPVEDGVRLAWFRLRYPYELSDSARASYECYLKSRLLDIYPLVLRENDREGLQILLSLSAHPYSFATEALEITSGNTAFSAILLEACGGNKTNSRQRRNYEL